jgi:hypothetical protein
MKIKHIIAVAIVMSVFAQAGHAQAQQARNTASPSVLSYHGVLNAERGTVNGNVDLTVALYSDPIGSFKIWEDTYNVRVDKGAFSVTLGSGKMPLPNLGNGNTWLRFTVNGTTIPGLTLLNKSDYTVNTDDHSERRAPATKGNGNDLSQIPGLGVNMVYDDQR